MWPILLNVKRSDLLRLDRLYSRGGIMRKVLCIAIFLGFVLIVCSEEKNVIDILDAPAILSVEQKENQNEINQITGVVCWGNCTNDDRSFSFEDIDEYTLNSLSIDHIKEDAIFQITHEGPLADNMDISRKLIKVIVVPVIALYRH